MDPLIVFLPNYVTSYAFSILMLYLLLKANDSNIEKIVIFILIEIESHTS